MPSPEISDETLLQRAGAGDLRAFEILYDRWSSRWLGLLRLMLGEEREAGDALQEGFLHLWDQARSYDAGSGSAFAWGGVLFRRRTFDRLRVLGRHDRLDENTARDFRWLNAASAQEGETVAMKERQKQVHAAMLALPEEPRVLTGLAFLTGCPYQVLAEDRNLPSEGVKAHLQNSVLRLGDFIRKEGAVTDEFQIEQAALNALHALDESEQSAFEISRTRDSALDALATGLEQRVAELAALVPAIKPLPAVKAAILAQVRARAAAAKQRPGIPARTSRLQPLAWGLAAVLAVGCFWLWNDRSQMAQQVAAMTEVETEARNQLIQVRDERDALEEQQAKTASEIARLTAEMEALRAGRQLSQ